MGVEGAFCWNVFARMGSLGNGLGDTSGSESRARAVRGMDDMGGYFGFDTDVRSAQDQRIWMWRRLQIAVSSLALSWDGEFAGSGPATAESGAGPLAMFTRSWSILTRGAVTGWFCRNLHRGWRNLGGLIYMGRFAAGVTLFVFFGSSRIQADRANVRNPLQPASSGVVGPTMLRCWSESDSELFRVPHG